MSNSRLFKWCHYQPDIILCCVRWSLSYPLSQRQVEELTTERGTPVDHSTVFRWVQEYAPALNKRCDPYLRSTTDSQWVDETYVKVKRQMMHRMKKGQTKVVSRGAVRNGTNSLSKFLEWLFDQLPFQAAS